MTFTLAFWRILSRWLPIAVAIIGPWASQAQVTFQIDDINYIEGNVSIEFTDSRLISSPDTLHALDFAASVGESTPWTMAIGATLSSLSSTRRLVTVPAPDASGFYRVGLDSDGDGLSDALEGVLPTDPNSVDTDSDGFSDGIEMANDTNPSDANSRPLRGTQPGVQFAQATSRAIEHEGMILIAVEFDTLYSGELFFSVSAMSNATGEVDFSVSQAGKVSVNGATALIPLSLLEDLEVEEMEAIVLELHDDKAGSYHVDANLTHTVLLIDNDANWSGIMQSAAAETSFRLCVLRSGDDVQAMLVPAPGATEGHLGGQLIPLPPPGQNGWPLSGLAFTEDGSVRRNFRSLRCGVGKALGKSTRPAHAHFFSGAACP